MEDRLVDWVGGDSWGRERGGKSSLSSDSFVPLVLVVQHLTQTWRATRKDYADTHQPRATSEDVYRLPRVDFQAS